jgi:hypothetical protein
VGGAPLLCLPLQYCCIPSLLKHSAALACSAATNTATQALLAHCADCLSCRFGEQLLKFKPGQQLPSLQQLEAALLGEAPPPAPPAPPAAEAEEGAEGEGAAGEQPDQAPPPDAAVQLQLALVDFLVDNLFVETAAAITGGCSSPLSCMFHVTSPHLGPNLNGCHLHSQCSQCVCSI